LSHISAPGPADTEPGPPPRGYRVSPVGQSSTPPLLALRPWRARSTGRSGRPRRSREGRRRPVAVGSASGMRPSKTARRRCEGASGPVRAPAGQGGSRWSRPLRSAQQPRREPGAGCATTWALAPPGVEVGSAEELPPKVGQRAVAQRVAQRPSKPSTADRLVEARRRAGAQPGTAPGARPHHQDTSAARHPDQRTVRGAPATSNAGADRIS